MPPSARCTLMFTRNFPITGIRRLSFQTAHPSKSIQHLNSKAQPPRCSDPPTLMKNQSVFSSNCDFKVKHTAGTNLMRTVRWGARASMTTTIDWFPHQGGMAGNASATRGAIPPGPLTHPDTLVNIHHDSQHSGNALNSAARYCNMYFLKYNFQG